MSYYVYRIPEKNKVGLPKNLEDRVERQQGYSKDEYEVLGFAATLEAARDIEKRYQEHYGCKHEQGEDLVDKIIKRRKMSKVFKTFEGNTIGFPVEPDSILDLLGQGTVLETNKGTYNASADDIAQLNAAGHFRKSKFANGNLKTYIYTKIVDNYFNSKSNEPTSGMDALLQNIHAWADSRGILSGSIETQTLKLGEEFGELQKAVLKDKPEDIKDAIGDIIVVLVSIAHFNGHSVVDAVQMAYDTISKRTGFTNSKGDFIKTHFNGKEIKDTL